MKQTESFTKRKPLIDQLPLDAPLGIHVCPSSFCNFRCEYCEHSMDSFSFGKGAGCLTEEFMTKDTFRLVVDQMREFSHPINTLNFAWMGEPTLNTDLPEMITMAKKAHVAKKISIVTNGSKLDKEYCDRLIEAQPDLIRLSLQGLNEESYLRVAQYKMDFQEFVSNIRYLYENKRQTLLYIKIMDVMLKGKNEIKQFHDMFDNICDQINVENLIPLWKDVDISQTKNDFEKNYFGQETHEVQVCGYPFFQIMIAPNGDIYPCCSVEYTADYKDGMKMGNIAEMTLKEYWMGGGIKKLRLLQLSGREQHSICAACAFPKYHTAKEDQLDDHIVRLKEVYGGKDE